MRGFKAFLRNVLLRVKPREIREKVYKFVSGKFFFATISAVALITSICTYSSQKQQSSFMQIQANKVDSLRYKVNALQFKPVLKILGNPRIERLAIVSRLPQNPFSSNFDNTVIDTPTVSVTSNILLTIRIDLVNSGNSLARIFAYATTDTLSDQAVIRELLSDPKSLRGRKFYLEPFKDYFENELQPDDSTSISIEHAINFIEDSKFAIHFIIFYENEIGTLYDTYFWAHYEILPILMNTEYEVIGEAVRPKLTIDKTQRLENLFKCKATKSSYDFYLEDEREIVRGIFYDLQSTGGETKPDLFSALVYEKKGFSFLEKGLLDSAITYFGKAIEGNSKDPALYFSRGNAFLDKAQYDSAIHDFTRSIEFDSTYAMPYRHRASAYRSKGDYENAIGDLDKSIAISPNLAGTYKNRGNVYADLGNLDLAIRDYTRAIELSPNYLQAYASRAEKYLTRGKVDSALLDLDKVIELNPNDPMRLRQRADLLKRQGKYSRAMKDYNRSIEIAPHFAGTLNNRGNLFHELGKTDSAIFDYSSAISLSAGYSQAYHNRASAFLQIGQLDSAILDYSSAIKLDSSDIHPLNDRGFAYIKKNMLDSAIVDFTEIIRIAPPNPLAYRNRGLANAMKSDFDAAISDFSEAIKFAPDDANDYYNRGLAYSDKGERNNALKDLRRALELSQDEKLRKSIEEKLKSLEEIE